MKVTIYAPPFRPPFFRSLENLYSFDPYILTKMRKMWYFDPYILAKMRKMSYFDPYFSSKLGKMYSFDPFFFFYPCSVSSRRALRSIPIRNLTEYSPPPPPPPPRSVFPRVCFGGLPREIILLRVNILLCVISLVLTNLTPRRYITESVFYTTFYHIFVKLISLPVHTVYISMLFILLLFIVGH